MFSRLLRPAISLLAMMTLLLGVVYPLAVAGVSRLAFPRQAGGSLIYRDGKIIGSALIGQSFSDPKYFWGRPSATAPQPYNGLASGGSNSGPLNPVLLEAVKANAKALRDADPDNHQPIPADLVTASGSGLDPEISPAAAEYQAARVARARHLEPARVRALIKSHQRERFFGLFGERRIEVLELNLALDELR
jgi:potassium-transporting ATPase KdpC subunit